MTPVRYTALAFQRLADPGTPHALAKRYGVRPGQPADAPLTSDGTLWFPDQHGAGSESHERRDGAVTMVGLRDDGSVSIADNAWLPEDHTEALRVELNIPSGW